MFCASNSEGLSLCADIHVDAQEPYQHSPWLLLSHTLRARVPLCKRVPAAEALRTRQSRQTWYFLNAASSYMQTSRPTALSIVPQNVAYTQAVFGTSLQCQSISEATSAKLPYVKLSRPANEEMSSASAMPRLHR